MADFESIRSTNYGKVEGLERENQYQYLGIPYAKPPVEELRFKRAVAPEAWENTIACKKMGPSPYQFLAEKMPDFVTRGKNLQSEDCLSLNIWAPKKAEKAPVFVWLYGGANHTGETANPQYSLEKFPESGVIGVSFNYRLGPLGFYDFSKLDASFDSNCAVSDMLMALTWIKENIENFGGDPNNITICGESAGGTAVYALLAAPSAKGLFNKAIAMSGLPGNVTSDKTQELNLQLFFDQLGLVPNNVAQLKTMPIEQMIPAASEVFLKGNAHNPGIFVSGIVIDDLVPKRPWEALADGDAKDVKCIFGTCRDEGTLFYLMNLIPQTWRATDQMLNNNNRIAVIPALRQLYDTQSEKKAMEAMGRDRLFWADSIKCSLAQSQHAAVWSYRYDFAPATKKVSGLGAAHGSDIAPALNTIDQKKNGLTDKILTPNLTKMRDDLHHAWINFARYGTPNGDLTPRWQTYDQKERLTYVFNVKNELLADPNRAFYDVWKDLDFY